MRKRLGGVQGLASAAAAFSALAAAPAGAALIWDGDASRPTSVVFGNLNCDSPGSITAVNDATRGLIWRYSKPNGSNRCENHGIRVAGERFVFQENTTYYLGWWSKLSSTVNSNANFQWKSYGNHIQNYPVLLKMVGGSMTLQYREPGVPCCKVLWSRPISANQWNHYTLGLHLSDTASQGWIEFWLNGEAQTLVNGSTRYFGRTLDDINEPKWGTYGASATAVTNEIDGLKVGTAYADVADGGGGGGGDIAVGRTEAEALTRTNFEDNTFEGASAVRATSTTLGNVRGTFGGATGVYDLTLRYHDENDGAATFRVRVNGVEVGVRTANVNDHTWKSWTIPNVSIANGDEVRVESARQAGEHARIDYIVIE